jgi:post-segregation antitoxin (ccd killing protein)
MKRKQTAGSSKSSTWRHDAGLRECAGRNETAASQWLKDNRQAIAAYNERILARGVFSDEMRRF